MTAVLDELHKKSGEIERKDARVVYAKRDRIIVGWAILADPPKYYFSGTEVHFFVKEDCRRRGIGSLLMRAARRHWGQDFRVCKHDGLSTFFFNSFN